MTVSVCIDIDLRPHEHRPDFNDGMELAGWTKFPTVATLWHRMFETNSVDVARDEAIATVRHAARAAKITFEGAVIAGGRPPIGFTLETVDAKSEDEELADLGQYVMSRWRSR